MKIACIGTHSSRKSTLSYQLAAYYKERGLNVSLIQEVARHSPLGINQDFTVESMEWIVHTQIAQELVACKQHDMVVCDRSIMDPLVYGASKGFLNFEKKPHLMNLFSYVMSMMNSYDRVFFVYPDVDLINDGVRDTNAEFRTTVHLMFKSFVEKLEFMNEGFMYKVKRLNASQITAKNLDLEHLLCGKKINQIENNGETNEL